LKEKVNKPYIVVFALYPRITQLDFTGPHEVLSRLPIATCVLGSSKGGQIAAEGGLSFETQAFRSISNCDLLCVPGGYGTMDAMQDAEFLSELKRLASLSNYVTSVCTGSLLLAAAGLLNGKRAACHWAWGDLLNEFDGVILDKARVVRDGNTFSGGGVTAGIDMAFTVMAEVAGEQFAKAIQLGLEYSPAPPFSSGHPDEAVPELVAMVKAKHASASKERHSIAAMAAKRLLI
jgi:cyclohexyl-isocyanide hydratase